MSRSPWRTALALLGLLALSGCGAYFNTYYNASQAYRKGEKTLAESGVKSARANYDDCMKISSKLLQFYPESRWVDDTILLIGQCYVRLEQHHRALRKFDELESRFPYSPLLPTGRVWRSRALLSLGREIDCLAELARLDLDRLERRDRVEALRVYADLYRQDQDRSRLLEVQDRLLSTARRNLDKAAAHADLAATFEEGGQWEEALKHYNAVRRYRPARALLFRSWLGSLDNSLRLGRLENVERRLRKLRKDERFYEERHALDLRQGWLAELQGRPEEAAGSWQAILKDFPRTESSAAAAHSLGRVYLFQHDQLDSARTYFKRTAAEKSASPWADSSKAALLLVEALDKAHREVLRLDEQMRRCRARLDPDSVRLEYARTLLPRLHARLDSLAADSLRRLAPAADSLLGGVTGDSLVQAAPVPPAPQAPPARPAPARRTLETERSRAAAARPALEEEEVVVGAVDSLRALNPETGRRGGGRKRMFDFQRREREAGRADSLRQAQTADSLRLGLERARLRLQDSLLVAGVLDTLSRRPPIDSLRLGAEVDSLCGLGFDQRFYLAELVSGRLRKPERADSLMRALIDEACATTEQASRLRYAYGVLRLDQFADSSGRQWLRQLIERWPLALAANPARDRLGLPRAMTLEDSAAVLLESAESLWLRQRDPLTARRAYHQLADRYPTTPQAGTALLAAGAIAWEELENPALAQPDYQRLLRDFPRHAGADLVRRRLGQAVAPAPSAQAAKIEEVQTVETTQVQLDESGKFIDPDRDKPIADRLSALRLRFRETGRLRLEQVLE